MFQENIGYVKRVVIEPFLLDIASTWNDYSITTYTGCFVSSNESDIDVMVEGDRQWAVMQCCQPCC